ncbi:MAG: hypothetical protein Tsb009_27990 [Planctomycetaceae bacterium]
MSAIQQQNQLQAPEPNRERKVSTMRWIIRISGAILWVMVAIVGYRTWQLRQQQQSNGYPEGSYRSDKYQRPTSTKPVFRPFNAPNFSLTEAHGQTVKSADLLGRPWVVCFTFTRCRGQCSRIESQMKTLQDLIAETDTRLVTITVDPDHDTPEILKKRAEQWDADPDRWLFLTGEKKDVHRVILEGFRLAVMENQGEDRKEGFEVTHSHRVLHVNRNGVVIGSYNGANPVEMSALRRQLVLEFREHQSAPKNSPGKAVTKENRFSLDAPVKARKPTRKQPKRRSVNGS